MTGLRHRNKGFTWQIRPTTLRYGSIYTNRGAASTVGLLDAAILVADVVDYNRLAGVDEEGTLARLRALRSDLINPAIAVHKGRVVKRTGDGLLAEFRSVVDAVRCAIELQHGMIERNAGVPAE
jgi:class 3 adenylate cyclase